MSHSQFFRETAIPEYKIPTAKEAKEFRDACDKSSAKRMIRPIDKEYWIRGRSKRH